jgi:polyisoprenoid-binding protein YceI
MTNALLPVALLTPLLGLAGPARASPSRWTADGGRSRITIHVFKKGLLSSLAHDHHFVPARWRATASFDAADPSSARVEVTVAADSLADEQPSLSAKDREKVDRQAAGPDVLDAKRYPEVRFVSSALELSPPTSPRPDGALRGTLDGTLSVHGKERPVSVPVVATKDGSGWRARGAFTFKQSDFGIRPYSGFAGTIAVRDELRLEYDLALVPAP